MSRTRCGILQAAPQSRDRTKRRSSNGPGSAAHRCASATRCAASGDENGISQHGRAARTGHRRIPQQAGSGAAHHPAVRSRRRPGARARRCAGGLRGRRSHRSVLAGADGRRRAFRRAVAAGRGGDDDSDVRRTPCHSRARRLAQFCRRRRYAERDADQGLPHRDRGRRTAPGIAAAQGLRARQDRGRDRLLSRRRARSGKTDRRRNAGIEIKHRIGRARGADVIARRRPPGLAQRIEEARALCPWRRAR